MDVVKPQTSRLLPNVGNQLTISSCYCSKIDAAKAGLLLHTNGVVETDWVDATRHSEVEGFDATHWSREVLEASNGG